jgi:hypothetical protein
LVELRTARKEGVLTGAEEILAEGVEKQLSMECPE